jgi:16S rRNA (cytidine1402-2'-O)-methyltransferase
LVVIRNASLPSCSGENPLNSLAPASFGAALQAARDAAGAQHYPQATLYVVATPIGNLADITLRALQVLQLVDAVACEDTRHTQSLLRAYGIDRPSARLLALHQHNEAAAAQAVIARLALGERIAYVSDAGTPGVSDPGARLVAAVREAGYRVLPLPGASSVTTLIGAAGLVATGDSSSAFVFAGFLPSKSGERDAAVQALAAEPRSVVLLEAPHRIEALARALAVLGQRRVTVGRELTKQFEEIATVAAAALPDWFAASRDRTRGEFALVLHPKPVVQDDGTAEAERVLRLLLAELPLKSAVRLAAEISGAPRNALYDTALRLREEPSD